MVLVIKQIGLRLHGRPILLITRMITVSQSVLLSLLVTIVIIIVIIINNIIIIIIIIINLWKVTSGQITQKLPI